MYTIKYDYNFIHYKHLQGTHGMAANQRRSCLALGTVISRIQEKTHAHKLLDHLHSWLEKDLHKGK